MNPLHAFHNNEVMRDAVKEFMVETLRIMTVEKVFNQESIEGIYEAKELVDKTFSRLEEIYEPNKKKPIENAR